MRYSDLIGTQMTYFSGGKITYSPYPSQELNWKSKKKLSTGRKGQDFPPQFVGQKRTYMNYKVYLCPGLSDSNGR